MVFPANHMRGAVGKDDVGKFCHCFMSRMTHPLPMNPPTIRTFGRRGMLGRMAALLAAGAWPGARAESRSVKPVRFVVANDFHHDSNECDAWMEALFRQMGRTENAAFCLALGDLANTGKKESLMAMKRLSSHAGIPVHVCPGNHDLDLSPVDGWFAEVFPGQRNQVIRHEGWQVVMIDSTEGAKWKNVTIADATLKWLDEAVAGLDPAAPTVLATHFPLASFAPMCPVNEEEVLRKFERVNLRGVFGGHFHGRTSFPRGEIRLVTNACCARVRGNHDNTPDKGWLVVDGDEKGSLTSRFQVFAGV